MTHEERVRLLEMIGHADFTVVEEPRGWRSSCECGFESPLMRYPDEARRLLVKHLQWAVGKNPAAGRIVRGLPAKAS